MASNFYCKVVVDYSDCDNRTKNRPGYNVNVVENDGGVGLSIDLIEGDTRFKKDSWENFRGVFFDVKDAEELIQCLREAINRAKPKNADHGYRTYDY